MMIFDDASHIIFTLHNKHYSLKQTHYLVEETISCTRRIVKGLRIIYVFKSYCSLKESGQGRFLWILLKWTIKETVRIPINPISDTKATRLCFETVGKYYVMYHNGVADGLHHLLASGTTRHSNRPIDFRPVFERSLVKIFALRPATLN